ncbi:unnamed protein product [Penicillium bialowiezense]
MSRRTAKFQKILLAGRESLPSILRGSFPCFFLSGSSLIMLSRDSKQVPACGMQEVGPMSNKGLDDANLARMGKRPVLKVIWSE